jgi:hypothetical protein
VSTGTKEDESSTGRVGLLDFTSLGPFSLGARFVNYERFTSLIFNYFSGRGKPRIQNQWTSGAQLYTTMYVFLYLEFQLQNTSLSFIT